MWQKDSKQCRGKDTALLHATKDVEGVGSGSIVQKCSLHVIMEGFHDAEKGRRTTDLGQDLEKVISTHKAECLGQVNKGNIKWLSLLSAFSCSCLSEKIMSMVAFFALNPH